MNHTIQMGKECALAAVCIALGINYNKTKDDFRIKHGIPFGDAADDPKMHNICLSYLKTLGINGEWFNKPEKGRYMAPDLSGRGIFTIRYANMKRHAVAYRDGKVYDPGFLYPMPYDVWRGRQRRFFIDGQERFK